MMNDRDEARLVQAYLAAKKVVLRSHFAAEVVAALPDPHKMQENQFLRELAWVVLSSGMAEAVVRLKFPFISVEFLEFISAKAIADQKDECIAGAFVHFRNKPKITAIAYAAERIAHEGFGSIQTSVIDNPIMELQKFPFIGPVTAYHLAKNLGVRTAKPDRHLVRLARVSGFADVQPFCQLISAYIGEDIRLVDLVLWRYATLNRHYASLFSTTSLAN